MRILHRINLETVGGVEVTLMLFLRAAAAGQRILVDSDINPAFRSALDAQGIACLRRSQTKRWNGVRLPRFATGLRGWNAARLLRDQPVDVVLGWNTFANMELLELARRLRRPLVYYEHGGAWTAGYKKRSRAARFFAESSAVICNSKASERLMALRWGYTGPVTRVYCPLSDDSSSEIATHDAAADGCLRLGAAGRLSPQKGLSLAVLALAELRARKVNAELHLAGVGPDERHLRTLAEDLNVLESVHFHGLVADMRSFYDHIHILLIPSLWEPFGRVSIEAQACGRPVVAAAVDGLEETLAAGESGETVPCSLSEAEYRKLGGSTGKLPEFVYDPRTDSLREPRAAEPAAIADAVCKIWASQERYLRYSASARRHALTHFSQERYIRDLRRCLENVLC